LGFEFGVAEDFEPGVLEGGILEEAVDRADEAEPQLTVLSC